MLSTLLILTQNIITGKQYDGVLCSRQKHVIRDLPISLVCLSASIRALTKFRAYKEAHSRKEAIHYLKDIEAMVGEQKEFKVRTSKSYWVFKNFSRLQTRQNLIAKVIIKVFPPFCQQFKYIQ